MNLKFTITALWLLLCSSLVLPQSIANDIKLDTLKKYLRELSGDTQISLGGNTYTITTRSTASQSISLTESYLKFRFLSYGASLSVSEQPFQFSSYNAKNIIAVQRGSQFPDKKYIICAHFDDVSNGPGADDNGSGTAAVLEAARVISKLNPKYTIIYALWSGEEQGLNGSKYYAEQARTNNEDIVGVINLDMISWDGDRNNNLAVYNILPSNQLMVDNLSAANIKYNINLTLQKNYSILSGSDHYSFYLKGFPAYCLIESDYSTSPYYHSRTLSDAFINISPSFLEKCAKLAILSLAELSGAISPVGIEDKNVVPSDLILHQNYPNPFNPSTVISYSLKWANSVQLKVYDAIGREVKTLVNENQPAGTHQIVFSVEDKNLTSGIYFYKLQAGSTMLIKKMIYLK